MPFIVERTSIDLQGFGKPPASWATEIAAMRRCNGRHAQRLGKRGQICGDHLRSGGDHAAPPHEMIKVGSVGDARVDRRRSGE